MQSLNLLNDMVKIKSSGFLPNVKNVLDKINKLESPYKRGKMDFNLIKYVLGLADCATQGQINYFMNKRKYSDETYKDKNTLEFNIQLNANHYTNFNSINIGLPIKIISKTNNANDIAVGTIPVNAFFAHCFIGIHIKGYGHDIPISPLTNTADVYRSSDAILKHIPEKALKTFEDAILYSKKNLH